MRRPSSAYTPSSEASSSVSTSSSQASPAPYMPTEHRRAPVPTIELAPEKQHEILTRINATVDHVLDSMVGDSPSKTYWRPKGSKKGIGYYVDDNVNPDQYRFCCVCEASASMEDIMELFMASDTDTLLKNNRVMYNNILDARVLGVLQKPTSEYPFKSLYLRHTSYEAPSPMSDRDLCVVVATDMFIHDDGSTIGYCLWDSVDVPECPDYKRSRGVVRSRMFRSGFFCRTSEDENGAKKTKVVYLVGMEPGGAAAPKFAAWLLMERFGANLARLCGYFRRRLLDPTTFRPRHEWSSTRKTRQCRGCSEPFGSTFTKRHHCVACGEVFCKTCYTSEQVDLPGVGITRVRLCFNCLAVRGIQVPKTHDATAAQAQRRGSLRRASTRTMDAPHGVPELLDDQVLLSGPFRLDSKDSKSLTSVR